MNAILWAVPLLVAISGVAPLGSGIGHLLRGRTMRGSGHLLFGAPLAIIGFVAGPLGLNAQTYARLTHEGPVAKVNVHSLDPASARYLVTILRLDGTNRIQTCELQGAEWVLSGRVQKWKPWANLLGLDATYALEQVSNMYFSAGRGKPIAACDIEDVAPRIDRYVPHGWLTWLAAQALTVERRFGSANYMPLVDGAVYRVDHAIRIQRGAVQRCRAHRERGAVVSCGGEIAAPYCGGSVAARWIVVSNRPKRLNSKLSNGDTRLRRASTGHNAPNHDDAEGPDMAIGHSRRHILEVEWEWRRNATRGASSQSVSL